MDNKSIFDFQQKIYHFYAQNKRDFAWRRDITPYRVFISEVMLQQTQTARVIFKFEQWTARFPTIESLAQATTHDVLATWQGLGYNRRGIALHKAARTIVEQFDGQVPNTVEDLKKLPGIGLNTAGSIMAFAFNIPVTFIETNIRTVFLYEFFQDKQDVTDQEILALVQAAVDPINPRDWYYALMDYGVHIKKTFKANNKSSKHYIKQSKFIGSRREVRGSILRVLTGMKQLSYDDLLHLVREDIPHSQQNIDLVIAQLMREGLLFERDERLHL